LCSVGFGLGSLLLFVIAYTCLLMSPVWNRICSFSVGNVWVEVWVLICTLGVSCAGLYAFRRLRHETTLRAGGPRRSLRDYRSPLFLALLLAWFVLACVLILAFHVSYMPTNDCLSDSQRFIIGPWQEWVAFPTLGCIGLNFLCLELMLARVASTRSPFIPTSLSDVAGLEDMFRDRIVRALQYWELMQIYLLSTFLITFISLPYTFVVVFLPMLLAAVAFWRLAGPSGDFRSKLSGGLGGRLSGWF
jgi:hypothetical protein